MKKMNTKKKTYICTSCGAKITDENVVITARQGPLCPECDKIAETSQ